MLQFAVVIRQSTLRAMNEHSTTRISGTMPLSESEAIILLDCDVVQALIDAARPDDQRPDDVIMRLAL